MNFGYEYDFLQMAVGKIILNKVDISFPRRSVRRERERERDSLRVKRMV